MNIEIEVGDFVRTKDGYIAKVIEIDEDGDYYTFDNYVQIDHGDKFYSLYKEELKNIKTYNKNKIYLVECGDYVNGWKVLVKTKIKNNEMQVCILTGFEDEYWITINNETLKSIVTKESFKEREYVF